VDLIADVLTNHSSLTSIGAALGAVGFEAVVLDSRHSPAYRHARGEEQVDVMVADHVPSGIRPRLRQHPAFSVEGGAQALTRRDTFVVTSASGTITISAPDVLGALVGKGAAFMVDPRDRGRHLEDAAVLLASIDSVGDLDLSLNATDRKRLRSIVSEMSDALHPAWLALGDSQQSSAQRNLALVIAEGRLRPS
jgi:hypothetical protein